MDPSIEAAARALAAGDALGALNRVALRDDAPALALRGIAMAQIGDMERARTLVRRAARAFGPHAALAQARCRLVEAEIALATRRLAGLAQTLAATRAVFDASGDRANAVYAALLQARHLLLTGDVEPARASLAGIDPTAAPAALRALHALLLAGVALRQMRAGGARLALNRAARAARRSGIVALVAEVDGLREILARPAASLSTQGAARLLRLEEVEDLLRTRTLVVDACRNVVQCGAEIVPLARRPVLFTLARALAQAWPGDVPRAALVAHAFRGKAADDTYRARLRVEIGRLRAALRPLAEVRATAAGYALLPHPPATVAVLARPIETSNANLLALLADGQAWSSSALALALGVSQRTLQRALDGLAALGTVRPLGRGRARRWILPTLPDIATNFLLTDALATA